MGSVKNRITEFKKTAILEEVANYFEKNDFNKTTIQDISTHIGISVGSLYNLFGSKEELFYAYIAHQRELFYTHLNEACSQVDDPVRSLEIFTAHKLSAFETKKWIFTNPMLSDPLFLIKLNQKNNNLKFGAIFFLEPRFQQICKLKKLKETDAKKLAYIFNSTVHGYAEYWLSGGSLTIDATQIVTHFFEGMQKR
jgi:AcrR family transcriptional regulator